MYAVSLVFFLYVLCLAITPRERLALLAPPLSRLELCSMYLRSYASEVCILGKDLALPETVSKILILFLRKLTF